MWRYWSPRAVALLFLSLVLCSSAFVASAVRQVRLYFRLSSLPQARSFQCVLSNLHIVDRVTVVKSSDLADSVRHEFSRCEARVLE